MTYRWEKWSVNPAHREVYDTGITGEDTENYLTILDVKLYFGLTYTENNGTFTVEQNKMYGWNKDEQGVIQDAVGTYYIKLTKSSKTYSDTDLKYVTYSNFYYPTYRVQYKTYRSRAVPASKGTTFYGYVESENRSAYPDNAESSGYWYVYAGIAYTPLYVKDNGIYTRVLDVYKKISGAYVKQDNIPALFPDGVKLRKGVTLANLVPASASRTEGLWSGGSIDTAHVHSALGLTHSLRIDGAAGAPEALSNCTTQMAQVQGHIYYWRIYEYHADSALNGCSAQIYWPIAEPSMGYVQFGAAGQWNIISDVIVRNSWASGNQSWRVDFNNNNLAGSAWYTGIMMVDLTAAYGAGKEPNKAWCDANIPYFTGMTGG